MPPPLITVKHRLGVTEADGYDAAADIRAGAEEDLASCRQFVREVSTAGVLRLQIHARKGLLGYSDNSSNNGGRFVGGGGGGSGSTGSASPSPSYSYSSATVANRHVPPLRHGVVHALAAEFPRRALAQKAKGKRNGTGRCQCRSLAFA